jgi:two-component system nitrogen regulation response regulator GlnG
VEKRDLLASTIEPARRRRDGGGWRAPGLTILFHPDARRVGDVAYLVDLLEGKSCRLSRLDPAFCAPGHTEGAPLADRHLSRTPAILSPEGEGVRLEPAGSPLRVDGADLAARVFSRRELERGVVLELAERVVLLLHLLGLPSPRQPDLGMVGESAALEHVRAEVLRVADRAVPVLIGGESGTGKELVARAVAGAGPRARGPFVAVNMAAVPPSVAAAELLGHAAGAFTGAAGAHAGHFAQADGGTLFLDEVGAAPLDVQAMLLRVLENGEVHPLGSERSRVVDVRVLAATDQDLEEAMRAGRFREALFHRLAGYRIQVPPLRERREDLGRLLIHFLREELAAIGEERRLAQLSGPHPWLQAPLVTRLALHDWPGNVRQLANVARHLVLASRGGNSFGAESLPAHLLAGAPPPPHPEAPDDASPRERRRRGEVGEEALLEALRANRWRIGPAARALGIPRSSLYSLIDSSSAIRKAKDVPGEELRACHQTCGGDVDAMAELLQVSSRGIRFRLKELGLA